MKIIVDELPTLPEECLFSEYRELSGRYVCMVESGKPVICELNRGKECLYFKKGEKSNDQN